LNYLRIIAAIFLFSSCVSYAEDSCLETVGEFGKNYSYKSFELNGINVVTTEPNPNGESGENIYFNKYTLNKNWVEIAECKSCNPRRSVTGLFLLATEKLPCNLTSSITEASILKKFGKPESQDLNWLRYEIPPYYYDSVTFNIENGKLKAIYWAFPFL
jgi:hypothetical protein